MDGGAAENLFQYILSKHFSDLGFSLLGKATANLPQALQLMVPPTKSPYGPVTKDICYNFKVATNCAIGTIEHGIKLLGT